MAPVVGLYLGDDSTRAGFDVGSLTSSTRRLGIIVLFCWLLANSEVLAYLAAGDGRMSEVV